MANIKKLIKFWSQYNKKDSGIQKGANEEIKRLERAYNRHRSKQKKK